ncbi:MAG: hypothetical protein COB98_08925 [Flavobacteriaceae bacterium]|nr:MAG: hypothetical protein COB98_08925 [Flavobacteriaceae bacterium]
MKYFISLLIILLGTELTIAQTSITDVDITAENAGEGDLYEHQISKEIFIGLSSGVYHNLHKGNIYTENGIISGNRLIEGNNKVLDFSNFNLFGINATSLYLSSENGIIDINANNGYLQLYGEDGIIAHDNATFEKNIYLLGLFIDGFNKPGTPGQILSSTGIKTEWVDQSSLANIYTSNGVLTNDRTLNGAGKSLFFTGLNTIKYDATNLQLFATNDIQIQTTGGTVQIAGPSGIQLQNNTKVTANLSVTGSYSDSDGINGTTGDVLSSTETGTDWHPLISGQENNAVTIGTDKGVFVKKQTIVLKYKESTSVQNWEASTLKTIISIELKITEDCLIDIDYMFSYHRTSGDVIGYGGNRVVYVDIKKDKNTFKSNQMSSISNTYEENEEEASCIGSRKYIFSEGSYLFTMKTKGTHNVDTHAQSDDMYGWSFDISATPINL